MSHSACLPHFLLCFPVCSASESLTITWADDWPANTYEFSFSVAFIHCAVMDGDKRQNGVVLDGSAGQNCVACRTSRPANVGILAVELVFPKRYVQQSELEEFDERLFNNGPKLKGKYTVGFGQLQMAFCDDREDVNSLALTVTKRILDRHAISPARIGRLEVGTETIVDKSKSVKTTLMQLWGDEHDVEGLDTTNACFGGTQALFNAVDWIESSSWNGRLALVVMADVAVYGSQSASARSTGGVGAAALLVGPGAPLVLEPGLRACYMTHVYDFYKPILSSEYPVVDGPLSLQSYMTSLLACYGTYCRKAEQTKGNVEEDGEVAVAAKKACKPCSLDNFDALLFHSPYSKLVQKALARLVWTDYKRGVLVDETANEALENYSNSDGATASVADVGDKALEKVVVSASGRLFAAKTEPSLFFSRRVGNMYTPSLYGNLAGFLSSCRTADELRGRRLLLFSYGSGCSSAMFSLRVREEAGRDELLALVTPCRVARRTLLRDRTKANPQVFSEAMDMREALLGKAPYEPRGRVDQLFPNTYYLCHIDAKWRRVYKVTAPDEGADDDLVEVQTAVEQ